MNKKMLLLFALGVLFIVDSQMNAAAAFSIGNLAEENSSQLEHTIEEDEIEETKHTSAKVCEASSIN
jgi:uncharacterized protein YcfJ